MADWVFRLGFKQSQCTRLAIKNIAIKFLSVARTNVTSICYNSSTHYRSLPFMLALITFKQCFFRETVANLSNATFFQTNWGILHINKEALHLNTYKRLPQHIGIIPDGNRRWALQNGYEKQDGYEYGISPGLKLYNQCCEMGMKEITFYGFTQDNTKRPSKQTEAFRKACVDSVMQLSAHDAELLIVGNTKSELFPKELLPFTNRVKFGKGLMRVNFLVNYGWDWDLSQSMQSKGSIATHIASKDISRIDLIIRWGGRRRLSGFLPIQTIYSDFYILDDYWPDFKVEHLHQALEWYEAQDITLGG